MSIKNPSKTGSIVSGVVILLILAASAWVYFNGQMVRDWISVQTYTPSSDVAAISERVDFTDKGKFIFYATKPEVEDQTNFNQECPRQESASPILGCYTTSDGIFIYNLTNSALDGMEEVTAAHEMLHAVWFRTSADDRKKLDAELNAAYDKLADTELKERMDYYKRTEPGEFTNELHSILGTEVASLGEPLESYYSQFFNRSKVLDLHEQYKKVYNDLYDRADVLRTEMESLATQINTATDAYNAAANQLSADIMSFNTKANNGGFKTQSEFNKERAALVARTNTLEANRATINATVDKYNVLYEEYQSIAKQIEVLNDSTDSFKQIESAPSV